MWCLCRGPDRRTRQSPPPLSPSNGCLRHSHTTHATHALCLRRRARPARTPPPRSRPPLPHASTLARRRSPARSLPLARAPPPHARTPPMPPSPARRPRHTRACRSPKHAAEPRRPRGRHPGAGTRPANGLDGAREPDVDALGLSPKGGRPAGLLRHLPHRCSSRARHARHPDADALAAGCWSPRPGWLRPGSALAAVTLAAATHVAPLVAARRGHNRCSPRPRLPLPAPTLDAPPTSTTSRPIVSPAVEP